MTTDPPLFDSAFLRQLERLHLVARQIFRGSQRAERRSRQTGSSLEYADHRDYAPGDDLRGIDWHVYGRLDRLTVKLYEEEQDLDVHLLVDASASMRWQPPGSARPAKQAHALRIAASLAYVGLANLDRVNVHWFCAGLGADMGLARGKSRFHKVLDFLKRAPEPEGATSLLASCRSFARRVKRRGVVFLVSDCLDPAGCDEALALLQGQRFQAQVIQVLDPAELEPELLGDLRLSDAEGGEAREVTVDEAMLRRYRERMGRFLEELETSCNRRAIPYARASTAVPFEEIVLRVLREGRLLK